MRASRRSASRAADFADRVADAGFDVTMRRYQDELAPELRDRYCVRLGTDTARADDVYVCVKPR